MSEQGISMRTFGLRIVILLVFTLTALGLAWHPVAAQPDSQTRVYLPLVARAAVDVRGEWIGFLVQPGKSFEFELSLTQSGGAIQGTSTARDGPYSATWSLTGVAGDTTITLNEQSITNSNPRPGTRWCMKRMDLNYARAINDTPTLTGTWSDPGCNAGQLFLQPKAAPFPLMSGLWEGIITQGETPFELTLLIEQNRSTFQGEALIIFGEEYGILSLVGHVAGSDVRIEETAVLETTGISWCVKTMVLKYRTDGPAPVIEGSWTAPGCVPGNLSLTRQPG